MHLHYSVHCFSTQHKKTKFIAGAEVINSSDTSVNEMFVKIHCCYEAFITRMSVLEKEKRKKETVTTMTARILNKIQTHKRFKKTHKKHDLL